MGDVIVNIADWAVENFGTCELGDIRRTRRAVQVAQQCDWVIRAAQLHRKVWTRDERKLSLQAALDEQPVLSTYELEVRAADDQPRRTARLEVRAVPVTLRRPKRATPYLKQIGFQQLTQ